MKRITIIGIALIGLALTSCNKEEDTATAETTQPTEADAVAIIEESLKKESGGEAKEIELMVQSLESKLMPAGNGQGAGIAQGNLECNVPFDTTVTYTLSGSATGSYTHNWIFLLNCQGGLPISLNVNANYEGEFSGPNIEREVNGNRQRIWTGLQPFSSEFVLNGSSTRYGTRTHNIGAGNTFTWTLNRTVSDLTVDKATHQILSGTATVEGDLIVSNGNNYEFDATVVFNGDGTATLTINGNEYIIELG